MRFVFDNTFENFVEKRRSKINNLLRELITLYYHEDGVLRWTNEYGARPWEKDPSKGEICLKDSQIVIGDYDYLANVLMDIEMMIRDPSRCPNREWGVYILYKRIGMVVNPWDEPAMPWVFPEVKPAAIVIVDPNTFETSIVYKD